ncbi:MAG: hypothetical protein H0W02_10110 [Ktedonobacteraceae bacterium]|nr:hypothetical protein [Ktedonobacteraceae bacterium]
MMSISESKVKEQLPPGAQISGSGKDIAGVIDERINTDGDVLLNQAMMMARARNGIPYEAGSEFNDEFIERVKQNNVPRQYVNQRLSQDTLNALAQGSVARAGELYNGVAATNAVNPEWTGYYLEPLAKFVVPFDTPVRNMLPRTSSVGVDVENWRAITDVFGGTGPTIGSFTMPQSTSNTTSTLGLANYTWSYQSNLLRQLAWTDQITFETELYARMYEPDVRAKIAAKLAPALMLGQETWYLNAGQQAWQPAPPNMVSTSATGGSVTANTYWIIVTAVTAASSNTGETLAWSVSPSTVAVPGAASVVTAGSTSTITFNINRVPGAIKYNVYMGTGATQPANSAMWLQAAAKFGSGTALNDPGGYASGYFTVTMTAAAATSGTAYSSVISGSAPAITPYQVVPGSTPSNYILTFDGLQALAMLNAGALSTAGVGGETATVRLVKDAGGVLAKSDIDTLLELMYLNARANPECMLVSVKDHKAISNIVYQSSNFRVNAAPTQSGIGDLVGGARATKWLNQTTGRLMDIVMCPYLSQGTIVFLSLTLPFQVAEIDKPPVRVSVNREMWAVEYPPDQSHMSQWAYAAYTSETLVNQYLGGLGLLSGIVTA